MVGGLQRVGERTFAGTRGNGEVAEPVAALYEQGRIHHVGAFPTLEDQQCAFPPL